MAKDIDTINADLIRHAYERYSETLLRSIADSLVKPRHKLPVDELTEKCIAALGNAVVVDRRINDLPTGSKAALIALAKTRHKQWPVRNFITLAACLGQIDGLKTIMNLLQAGLVVPYNLVLPIEDWEQWYVVCGGLNAECVIPENVCERAAAIPFDWPKLPEEKISQPFAATDFLEIPLRLAATRQKVEVESVKLTKTNQLYKRDQTRFESDPLLARPGIFESGILSLHWASAADLLKRQDDLLTAQPFPSHWEGGDLFKLVLQLYKTSFTIETWDPLATITPEHAPATLSTSALLIGLMLSQLKHGTTIQAVADWLWEHHPHWPHQIPKEHTKNRGFDWIKSYVLGVTEPLGIMEIAGENIRLTPLGKHFFTDSPLPETAPIFPQALMVQPNAEIIAYRQGLSPHLISQLSRFAEWKVIGPACTFALSELQVYAGLESGMTVAEILQILQKHGSRAVPTAVDDLIRRWGSKRERVTVFTSATLVEFASGKDLEEAMSKGIVSIRLTERVALTADGRDPEYTSLRLTGNRDYETKRQICLKVQDDGMTAMIDPGMADLLLDTELARISTPDLHDNTARKVKFDPTKIRTVMGKSSAKDEWDEWFISRTGHAMPSTVALFSTAQQLTPMTSSEEIVVRFPNEESCSGAMTWPVTAGLIRERIGPSTVIVNRDSVDQLQSELRQIGLDWKKNEGV
jgi:hypothetical protein